MPTLVRAAAVQDIPPGHSRVLHIQGREIALFNAEGTFYAVKNICPHRGVALDRGVVEHCILTCPGHSWQFDLRTGDCVSHPPAGLRSYPVEVRGDSVWIEVP
jgi:nitrite reductase/ring-hydroxylating ferredoxin subunit